MNTPGTSKTFLPTAVLSTTKGLCKKQAGLVQFVDKPINAMHQAQPEILFSPPVLNMHSQSCVEEERTYCTN